MNLPLVELQFLINHVFLPPKLPQSGDDLEKEPFLDRVLLRVLRSVIAEYEQHVSEGSDKSILPRVSKMISTTSDIQGSSSLDGAILREKLQQSNVGDVICLHITQQNAGVVIRRSSHEAFRFEIFEVLPMTLNVLESKGRLLCSYPGPSIEINRDALLNEELLEQITSFLEKMTVETLEASKSTTRKAGKEHTEDRESTNPRMITTMLTGILRGISANYKTSDNDGGDDCVRIEKCVRDEVLWKSARVPFRRSALWLVLRVALQTTLHGHGELYKSLMLYFQATILQQALDNVNVDGDVLSVMSAKLARRASKLSVLPSFVSEKVKGLIDAVNVVLRRIRDEQEQMFHPKIPKLETQESDLREDIIISPSSGLLRYVDTVLERPQPETSHTPFSSNESPRNTDSNDLPQLTQVPGQSSHDLLLSLGDVEMWVERKLSHWTNRSKFNESACGELAELLARYFSLAETRYRGSPTNLSLMILTILELWTALDRLAIESLPMLKEYDHDIPRRVLDPLLLPGRNQLKRLHKVEDYLEERRQGAERCSNPSLFSNSYRKDMFAVRYFDIGNEYKQLHARIFETAKQKRQAKKEEWAKMRSKYDGLIRLESSLDHEYNTNYNCHRWCSKCSAQKEARALRIDVHEWPLPGDADDTLDAPTEIGFRIKCAIFELKPPPDYIIWRDTTYSVIFDILSTPPSSGWKNTKSHERLAGYHDLISHFSRRTRRLGLGSITKSFRVAHYRRVKVSGKVAACIVPHGSRWELFDQDEVLTASKFGYCDIRKRCTISLPEGPYKRLQYTVDNTSHTSNDIIARQDECSPGISLHAYTAFAELRAGVCLQWLNIARELGSKNLTFKDESVAILLLQTAWQAQESHDFDYRREAHLQLTMPSFAMGLLEAIKTAWDRIAGNWNEMHFGAVLIALNARILALGPEAGKDHGQAIDVEACSVLRKARQISFSWLRQILQRSDDIPYDDHDSIVKFRALVFKCAAICKTTYRVDAEDLSLILQTPEDLQVLVQCTIITHDTKPISRDCMSPLTKLLVDEMHRLSWEMEATIRDLVRRHGLDQAVHSAWHGYQREEAHTWKFMDTPNERWAWTISTQKEPTANMEVHYNILTGQLLISGSPIKRLPDSIVEHGTYSRIFGSKTFSVSPLPGSVGYRSQQKFQGYGLFFRMEQQELVIRAEKDNEEFELIPHPIVRGDFPLHFVEGYAHWLNCKTHDIEFRPLKDIWTSSRRSSLNLKRIINTRTRPALTCSLRGSGTRSFIYRRSDTAKRIFAVFCPKVENEDFVQIFVERELCQRVCIHLPRLKLDFFINEQGHLESVQFRNMIVDPNQQLGTLTGLYNRLVLCGMKELPRRKVLIPEGVTNFGCQKGRVRVNIVAPVDCNVKVAYHVFDVDKTLQGLKGNGSMSSRLFKIYLHALTSHPVPDSLTGRTGTEEAFYDLRSAATWSFQSLSDSDYEMLENIASVTPTRSYYPENLRVMQTVDWSDLPMTTQHDGFLGAVEDIVQHSKKFALFMIQPVQETQFETERHLVERAAARNMIFYNEDIRPRPGLPGQQDIRYNGRYHHLITTEKILQSDVYHVACKTERWSTTLDVDCNMVDEIGRWSTPIINGDPIRPNTLGYEQKWFTEGIKLRTEWFSICKTLSEIGKETHRYRLLFFLSTLAFSGKLSMNLIWTLLSFSTNPEMRGTLASMPHYGQFYYDLGTEPTELQITARIRDQNSVGYKHPEDVSWDQYSMRKKEYDNTLDREIQSLSNTLFAQRTAKSPSIPSVYRKYLETSGTLRSSINELFSHCYQNDRLKGFVRGMNAVLITMERENYQEDSYTFDRISHKEVREYRKLQWTTSNTLVDNCVTEKPIQQTLLPLKSVQDEAAAKLRAIVEELGEPTTAESFEGDYLDGILESLKVLLESQGSSHHHEASMDIPERNGFGDYRHDCKESLSSLLLNIQANLESGYDQRDMLLVRAGLSPRITATTLLRRLATSSGEIPTALKNLLLTYAEAVTLFQRTERMCNLGALGNRPQLSREVESWAPAEFPDWRLLEIENDISIRPVQGDVALQMIRPSNNGMNDQNVLQLNMGEGKSSVIVPIVCSALADGTKLIRVVVLKPLAGQMFRLLVQKLGELINRRVYYIPFSRSVQPTPQDVSTIRELFEECKRERGIWLVQPEHILSFKLMGLDKLYTGNQDIASPLLDTQRWLQETSKDILDESDEILHVKYQLIYTLGTQSPINSDRCHRIQRSFDLVKRHANAVQGTSPKGIEVRREHCGDFPRLQIFEAEAADHLTNLVQDDLKTEELSPIPVSGAVRESMFEFIINSKLTAEEASWVTDSYLSDTIRDKLLHWRGLIGHGLLKSAFADKRWRVDYGLDETRTMYAVPYRAKDSPAPRAEFSHPDMAIILTGLSYYWKGLSSDQLETCFEFLLKEDEKANIYSSWVRCDCCRPEADTGTCVPTTIRTLQGVNLDDPGQFSDVVLLHLRHRKAVIDFYLAYVVFPKEAKEFDYKLSTSAWDLAEEKHHATTGFSGTNDNRKLLPLSIRQLDMPHNKKTNAEVLTTLLQPENIYHGSIELGGTDKVRPLLSSIISQKNIRVILDVGAHILCSNAEVATLLFELTQHIEDGPQAVVCFDHHDELVVHTRDGEIQTFAFSPFAMHMEHCFVYLDDAHTRGTDLKLPLHSRAAVTLGPKLVKDRLVQACMRMRQLGKGQSVTFFSTPDVHQSIIDACPGTPAEVGVQDVLRWSLLETMKSVEKNAPLWACQGLGYQKRQASWTRYCDDQDEEAFIELLKEKDSQTLQALYGVTGRDPMMQKLQSYPELWNRSRYFGIATLQNTLQQEEQEREIQQEIIQERHVERPPRMSPHKHTLHKDLLALAYNQLSTIAISESVAFCLAFDSLKHTSLPFLSDWSPQLLVTRDFAQTVVLKTQDKADQYLRRVSWLLCPQGHDSGKFLIIISPFEANELLRVLRNETLPGATLCVYSPRVTDDMQAFEISRYRTPWKSVVVMPPSDGVLMQLELFAGRLCLESWEDYRKLCAFLGLHFGDLQTAMGLVDTDRFVKPKGRVLLGMNGSPFVKSPMELLRGLTDLRRKGQKYDGTHWGRILNVRVLRSEDFSSLEM